MAVDSGRSHPQDSRPCALLPQKAGQAGLPDGGGPPDASSQSGSDEALEAAPFSRSVSCTNAAIRITAADNRKTPMGRLAGPPDGTAHSDASSLSSSDEALEASPFSRSVSCPVPNEAVGMAAAGIRKAPALLLRRGLNFRPPALDVQSVREESKAHGLLATPDCQSLSERFQVQEALGEGAFAVVYRAKQLGDGASVALKMFRTDSEEILHTAREEYELLRSLNHPHIIRAHDIVTVPARVVVVLEFFDGKCLDAVVAGTPEGRLQEASCRRLFGALLGAVEYLHKRGVMHRDVKAANILASPDLSDLRLLDFNVAQNALAGGALTLTGTADYMPPEVLLGDPHSWGSDVWASGLCLSLMAAGRKPLECSAFASHEALARAATARARAPLAGAAWRDVSEQCKHVVRRCLEPELGLRSSAAEILGCEWLH